ncbi:amidohydrolase family protein [Paucibacter sp. PLA-PC-4]|uniref:metal-dependent hydrolase family protein n=1 Tax=Paucibacter sp. PLA-PC-4 TaxID=2993655 RepID=UPI002248DC73|nr:amidohydrolase family protein [Paucibacter sp. PLA-PC-4]MCX2862632.1 amidohydrolase family protein [Paucibacter sp. PLA-PC-4]
MSQSRIVIRNALLFDSASAELLPRTTVVIEGERIVEVTQRPLQVSEAAQHIDAGGRVLLPGLIDAHVHVMAVSHDVLQLSARPPSLITAQSKPVLEALLMRGYTSVRDAGGADFGLQEAVASGLFIGPRLFIAGQPLSQTGGHADARPKGTREMFCTCAGLGLPGLIADGDAEVRRAAREQVRNGVNQIKVMAGGGVASPTDPIDGTQYSIAELAAICEEAEAANLYVMAHAYSPRSIIRAVQAGVRSIEHGNLLDETSAREMKRQGAYLVPTLATYEALGEEGARLGWSAEMLAKLERVKARGIEAIQLAKAEGIPIAFGTDLLGHMQPRQNREFALRAAAMGPLEILQSATSTAAELMRQQGQIGRIQAGAYADLLLVEGDPRRDLAMLAEPEQGLALIMKAGHIYKNRTSGTI